MNTPLIFKKKSIVNFRKYRSRKKVEIWWSKNDVTHELAKNGIHGNFVFEAKV